MEKRTIPIVVNMEFVGENKVAKMNPNKLKNKMIPVVIPNLIPNRIIINPIENMIPNILKVPIKA
jgi:hypothetical protein